MMIRDATATDIPFVYSSWLKSYRYDSYMGKYINPGIFKDRYKYVIDHILLKSHVSIATSSDDPYLIMGYIVFEPGLLHYIFVKDVFEKNGIARILYDFADQPKICTHKTISAQGLFKKLDLLYDPFILFKKGDPDGTTEKDPG